MKVESICDIIKRVPFHGHVMDRLGTVRNQFTVILLLSCAVGKDIFKILQIFRLGKLRLGVGFFFNITKTFPSNSQHARKKEGERWLFGIHGMGAGNCLQDARIAMFTAGTANLGRTAALFPKPQTFTFLSEKTDLESISCKTMAKLYIPV